jgi:hypothetical protein
VVLPFQLEFADIAAGGDRILQLLGVLHQDVECIGAGRHTEAGDVEIGSGSERGGGIRAGAPYG